MKNLLSLILVMISMRVYSHDAGSITGKVCDAGTGGPLIGVVIQARGSLISTTTDINGEFRFRNMPAGKYEISFSYIGYATKIINTEVRENAVLRIDILLEESVVGLSEITIEAARPVSAASSRELRAIDIQLKPLRSSQDMLLMVPGLFIAQHQGGGKAEQVFLRGFDCDHGTDISVNVDGMPVNMVTHAHGQGYADLHFLISEVVDGMEINKGPYLADYGDFYTAGAVNFKTKDILEKNLVKIEGGEFNTQKYTLLLQPENGGIQQNGYLAMQYHHFDGPFISPEKFQRMNLFGKYFFRLGPNSRLTFSGGGFSTGWNASGQIPERAVKEGLITRFGGIDNMEGGVTDRKNVIIKYEYLSAGGGEFELNTWLSDYNFKLFSDFTYFLNDPVNGDMIEQNEHRTLHGMNGTYKFSSSLLGFRQVNRIGGGFRSDNIDIQLWHSPDRIRIGNYSGDLIVENNLNGWFQQEFVFSPRLRMIWGFRHDYFNFSGDNRPSAQEDSTGKDLPHASGTAYQSVFCPKLNLVYSPARNLDLFLNFGEGFHSNDARGVITGARVKELTGNLISKGMAGLEIDSVLRKYNYDPEMKNTGTLPKAIAGETGVRGHLKNKFYYALSVWYLGLQKEYVYSGDGGITELNNPTRRFGFDAEARLAIKQWLWADIDISSAKATIDGLPSGKNFVPLAPRLIASGGISIIREKGFSGALRLRYLSDRPANEDNSIVAEGHTLMNANISYSYGKYTLSLSAENLLNTLWNEAQFATETRLKNEEQSYTDLCFTPGNPRNLQFGLSLAF